MWPPTAIAIDAGPGQTLQPTALVHEAWLRILRGEGQQFENRGHFFAAAAEAMRRILIERARCKSAQRHGGGLERVNLDQIGRITFMRLLKLARS